MKKIFLAISVITCITFLLSCKKNEQRLIETTSTDGNAFVKINYVMPFTVNSTAQIKVNGDRVSNLVTFPTTFPAGGLNANGSSLPDYLSIKPGSTTLLISRPNVGTAMDSVILYTGTLNLDANKGFVFFF